jgi:hypothetical protein
VVGGHRRSPLVDHADRLAALIVGQADPTHLIERSHPALVYRAALVFHSRRCNNYVKMGESS